MLQQILAILVIIFFLVRIFIQKKRSQISAYEFIFWLFFWLLAFFAVVFLKDLDKLMVYLGFSASGIEIVFYVAVVSLFYFVLRLNFRIEKIERNITKLTRKITLRDYDES